MLLRIEADVIESQKTPSIQYVFGQTLMKMVKPDRLAVVTEADHFCLQWRGVEDIGAKMTNSLMRGAFLRVCPGSFGYLTDLS
jgi:GTP cyclohydrolase I